LCYADFLIDAIGAGLTGRPNLSAEREEVANDQGHDKHSTSHFLERIYTGMLTIRSRSKAGDTVE